MAATKKKVVQTVEAEPSAPTTYPYPLKHWLTGQTLYTAQIDLDETKPDSLRMGAAVKLAVIDRASLVGASLDGASLDRASLDGARLDGARLDGASLDGASLDRARLDGASLDGASLVGARLVGASLDGASLVGARLDGARLDRASLVGASLVGARLDGASLVGASLDGARLDGARLVGARLVGALYEGRKVARIIQGPQRKDGYRFFLYMFQDGTELVRAGCQSRSMESYRAHTVEYGNAAKAAATNLILDYLEAASKLEAW